MAGAPRSAQITATAWGRLNAPALRRLARMRLLHLPFLLTFVLGHWTLVLPATAATGPTVSVAAASNLVYALDALNAAFLAIENPKSKIENPTTLTVTTGASGNFVAQIKNGAPVDVFLSADLDYPQALVASGHADAKSLTTFATGRLVLWTTRPVAALALTSIETTVRDPAVKKLAVANPDTAPYGRAALQTLDRLGLSAIAQPKLVTGENITQTAQFVETGSADAGFVALSLVLSPRLKNRGRWLEVPSTQHTSLAHGVVLTTRGTANPAAARYLAFLRSEPAKKILRDFGYATP